MERLNRDRNDTTEIIFHDEDPRDQHRTDQEEKSEALFDALKSDPESFITVHRQPLGGNNAMEFVGRFDADKYDLGGVLAHIQKVYGGGEYRVKGYAKGKITANKLISIAHPISPKSEGGENNMMQSMLTQMEKMQQQIVNLAQEKNTGTNSRADFLQEMVMMKQFFNDNSSKSGGISEILTVVSGLKELGINVGVGQSEENEGFGGMLEKFVPLATAMMNQPQAPAKPIKRPMKPAPKVNPTEPLNTVKTPEDKTMNMLQIGVAQLVSGAKKASDPYNYAQLVIDNVPEAALNDFFLVPSLDKLIAVNPAVAQHTAWFTDLGEHIKAMLGLPSKFSDLYDDEDDEDGESDIDPVESIE